MAVADQLAGKRFFVTGATGFLGTALVERLLRTIPDAEVVVLVRPGRRASAAQRAAREILKNDCFDRLRDELGDRFADETARRLVAVAGDVGRDGLGLDDEGRRLLAACDVVIHSAATVSFDAPLDQAVEINLLGPSRVAAAVAAARRQAADDAPPGGGTGASPPRSRPPDRRLDRVRRRHPPGRGQGRAADNQPVHARRRLGGRGGQRPPAPRRPRGRVAPSGPAGRASPSRPGPSSVAPASTCWPAGPRSSARSGSSDSWSTPAPPGPRRSAGRTPTRSPRRSASGRCHDDVRRGDAADHDRPAVDHRVGPGRARPGWIRGFRMAEPIIVSYARGLLREFPGVPEGVIDVIPVDMVVAAILAVAARGPDARRARRSSRSPPASATRSATAGSSSSSRTGSAEHPLYDDRGQPIVVPAVVVPRPRPGAAPAPAGHQGHGRRRAAGHRPAGPRATGRAGGPARGPQRAGQAGPRLRRAVRRLHRDRGPLPGRPAARALPDSLDPADRDGVLLRPGRHRLGPLRPRRPPAVGRRARPGPDDPGAVGRSTSGRTGPARPSSPPTDTWRSSTSSTR